MAGIRERIMAAITAFREPYLISDTDNEASDFNTWEARRLRYALLQAHVENSAYRDVHMWTKKYKSDYGLYKFTRNIYNPAYRLAEFYRSHIFGGRLGVDSEGATDGGAIPIATDNAQLRTAIAALWKASNWQSKKGVFTLRGASLGDTLIQIVDDPTRKRVYLHPRHPGVLKSVTLDVYGNAKGYVIEESRTDPLVNNPKDGAKPQYIKYTEVCTRVEDSDEIKYATYRDGALYDWTGNGAEWSAPYGFVPMVLCKHNDIGMEFGWAEVFPGLSKIREADDIASKLSDQIRKSVDPVWFFTGVKGNTETKPAASSPDSTAPEKGRQDMPALYAPADANAKAMVADVDIAGTIKHIEGILAELEREYPELKVDELRLSGGLTGRAMKLAQQSAEDKVIERRANYDDAMVRAHQMGIAIGGFREYAGYEGFNLDSYAAGNLEHAIADRPVFGADPLEEVEYEKAFWDAAKTATSAGMPLSQWLVDQGWSEQDIANMQNAPEYQQRKAIADMALSAQGAQNA